MAKPKKDKTIQLLNEIEIILQRAGEPLHIQDITEAIGERGNFQDFGHKPTNDVYTALYNDINGEGEGTRFRKSGKATFGLIEFDKSSESGSSASKADNKNKESDKTSHAAGFIQAFGMYWRRDMVDWKNQPSLWGVQQRGAEDVDFGGQKGVYLLHDGRTVIYVGRTTDQAMAHRLFQHTYDRLNGRWDRFSWFGVLPIDELGKLVPVEITDFTVDDLISAMEALLIEAVEPPQNRRRGDQTAAVEFLQAEDKGIKQKKEREMLSDFLKKIGA